ncbi:unnamed protein product [Paramecium octaurelia]|uniref:Uncharacterized protein n=1 Tax=Paramecium octaurelia TaxID=43137 RepID=A0A8S1S0Q7_PAROT|nr:unnamed protein product [Paramecium octaurelia]
MINPIQNLTANLNYSYIKLSRPLLNLFKTHLLNFNQLNISSQMNLVRFIKIFHMNQSGKFVGII